MALLPLFGAAEPRENPEALLREHVQELAPGTSMVTMVIDLEADGPQRQLYRYADTGEPLPEGDSLFEIGSVTKIFTSLLLADMVGRGEVTLDTTVGEIVPTRQLPEPVSSITLLELSQHTSGLPRLPSDPASLLHIILHRTNPYSGLHREDLYGALESVKISGRGDFAYSNLGVALLGQLLAERAGEDYWPLLQERVLLPRGLTDIHLDDESVEERLLHGHRRNGLDTSLWEMGAYAPAGDLSASVESLARLLELQMTESCPLWKFCIDGDEKNSVPLAWMVDDWQGETLVWHNGGTGGFRSFVGFVPEQKRGVVVLSNRAVRVGYLAEQLLGNSTELVPRPEPRYLLILCSISLVFLVPFSLGVYWWNLRSPGRKALLWCRLFLAGGWRWRRREAGRWEYLAWLGAVVPLYALLAFFGAWEAIPVEALWASASMSAVLIVALLIRPEAPHRGTGEGGEEAVAAR
ncbi:serine hydrolase domain-containing protein [Microbulbifer halophilus]|uniref:Serine hydrolase domain-containing protein n=1 Tax=Microbulbifer halophilus TaxID=453963 RepID=A0ABW5E8Z7_9GAMM|nr:serine hydrolase domain-containing protein [Microbulbifer halophilus]MCW8124953.1 serine hydrolase [Microbulbifer halophilus]